MKKLLPLPSIVVVLFFFFLNVIVPVIAVVVVDIFVAVSEPLPSHLQGAFAVPAAVAAIVLLVVVPPT